MYSQLEQDDAGNGCPLPDDPTAPVKALCSLGSMPSYVVNATGPDAVGAAVRFAAQYNLRLRVKSVSYYIAFSLGSGCVIIYEPPFSIPHGFSYSHAREQSLPCTEAAQRRHSVMCVSTHPRKDY